MMTKRSIWMAVAVSLVMAAGCKKDGKKDGQATGSGAAAAAGAPAGAPAAAATAAALAALPKGVDRLLAVLPKASEIVIGIDVARLRSSALLGSLFEQMSTTMASRVGFDAKAVCGIDPNKMIGTALIGITSTSPVDGEISGAFSGMDKAAMLPCIEKARASIEAERAQLRIDGDYVFISSTAGGKAVHLGMAFTDDGVGVMRFSNNAIDKAELEKMAAARAGDGLTGSKEFMAMVKATNTGATIWGLANGGGPLMQRSPVKFKSAFGSIDITDGIKADARMRMDSAKKAKEVADMFGGQLATAKQSGLADVAEMKPDGNDVRITFSMTKQQVEMVKTMVGSMIGNMMGGGKLGGGPPPPAPPSGP
jgi:hypothetical protein